MDDIYKDTEEVCHKLGAGNHLEDVEDCCVLVLIRNSIEVIMILYAASLLAVLWMYK